MLAAAADTVEEVGYARMTVAQVISRARVSRKTFYDVFADREDCFLAAFEQATAQATVIAREAYEREAGVWREGVRAALNRLLMFMDEEPGLAKLCVVEGLAAGEKVLERRAELLDQVANVIDQGRYLTNGAREPPAVTAEGIVGGVFAVIHTRLLDQADEPLTDLLGPLMSMIVLPYLGARAATRELARPAVEVARERQTRARTRRRDPLEGLKMRLTYRTVRVLMVIAEHPGASNREIAEGSGIVDQGQISKLLNRLARLDLIENRGEGQEKGAANAWYLTARGAQVERATRPR
jgi:AcrR family transcriptional regulator/DNA-binding MarR family transcriptional regulator